MFADNGKISPRQVSCLLFTDWVGKLLLLLPRVQWGLTGWEFLAMVALGGSWTGLYLVLIARLSARVRGSFTDFLRRRLGKYPAYLVGCLALLYLLLNLVYVTRMTGRICGLFLLPEVPESLLALCALAAGAVTALGDSQKRGRAAEILAFPIAIALAVMVAAAMGSAEKRNFLPAGGFDGFAVLVRSGAVFAGFSGALLILYETPHVRWAGKGRIKALEKGFGAALAFLLAAFLTAFGVLGKGSFARLPWPVLSLMSSASLPGGFLQRWDAVFLAFLLFSLLLACGISCHFMKRVLAELCPKRNTERLLFLGMVLAAFFLAGDLNTAEALFFRWGLCCLVPILAALPVFLIMLERIKSKCRQEKKQ